LKEIEAVANHHAHRYAVVPLLKVEPVGIGHLLELSGYTGALSGSSKG
jgi:arsenite-transporting ATPase